MRTTGRSVDTLETRFFTFGDDGRIASYRPILDTPAVIDAFTRA